MTWPTDPDGSNKTMGEMTAEERRVQAAASVARIAEKLARPSHPLADIAAANPETPWSRQLRMQGEAGR